MFGIGTTELIIILLVALIVLGPTKLPGIARSLGKALGEFRRVTTDVQRTLNLEAARIEEDEREKKKAAAPRKAEAPESATEPTPEPAPTKTEPKTGSSTQRAASDPDASRQTDLEDRPGQVQASSEKPTAAKQDPPGEPEKAPDHPSEAASSSAGPEKSTAVEDHDQHKPRNQA